jgi:hypothetical protein
MVRKGPWVRARVRPESLVFATQARAMRGGSHPVTVGLAENP